MVTMIGIDPKVTPGTATTAELYGPTDRGRSRAREPPFCSGIDDDRGEEGWRY